MKKREIHESKSLDVCDEEPSAGSAIYPKFIMKKTDSFKETLEARCIQLQLASIFVSICTNMAAHLFFDTASTPIDFRYIGNYLSIPMLFFWDAVFFGGIILLLSITRDSRTMAFKPITIKCSENNARRRTCSKVTTGLVTVLTIVLFFISSFEAKLLINLGECIPWDMASDMWENWGNFQILIESKVDEGFVKVWMICAFQIFLTCILFKVMSYFKRKRVRLHHTSKFSRNTSPKSFLQRKKLYIFIAYLLPTWANRPTISLERLWLYSMYSIPQKILYGDDEEISYYHDDLDDVIQNENQANGISQHTNLRNVTTMASEDTNLLKASITKRYGTSNTTMLASEDTNLLIASNTKRYGTSNTTVAKCSAAPKNTTTAPQPLNIFLILLESVRGDLMPFDSSTPWAVENIPESKQVANDITPFYSKWVKDPSTLYIPRIRSASGLTHKSLTSILCSLHALPIKLTQEHNSQLYHDCFPSLLQKTGHGYKNYRFFKSLTSWFDKQTELMANIGFKNTKEDIKFYGEAEYNEEHHQTDPGPHRANYFGYEDNPFLVEVMEWVDEHISKNGDNKINGFTEKSKENSTKVGREDSFNPFFLSYLTGVTHDPYNTPPKISWTKKDFVHDQEINNLLNGVAYTDVFLSKLIDEFRKRDLMKSTLFVIMGDHGANFKNRNNKMTTYEENKEESFDVGVSFRTEHEETAEYLKQVKNCGVVQKGTWSTIDVLPTIVELLNLFSDGKKDVTKLLNGFNEESIVDGRSMLHPSGRRLLLSIANPGHTIALKDGSYVLIQSNASLRKPSEVYDLQKDPFQLNPIILDQVGNVELKKFGNLIHWGRQAVKFVKKVRSDLWIAHRQGKICVNCALSLLNSLESLDQWDEYETQLF